MSQYGKEFPAQTRERYKWIIDTVRENQFLVGNLLWFLNGSPDTDVDWTPDAKITFSQLYKHDRDALLVQGGILTDDQIEILSPGRLSQNAERDQSVPEEA
jgi:hypothetical protein